MPLRRWINGPSSRPTEPLIRYERVPILHDCTCGPVKRKRATNQREQLFLPELFIERLGVSRHLLDLAGTKDCSVCLPRSACLNAVGIMLFSRHVVLFDRVVLEERKSCQPKDADYASEHDGKERILPVPILNLLHLRPFSSPRPPRRSRRAERKTPSSRRLREFLGNVEASPAGARRYGKLLPGGFVGYCFLERLKG